MSIGTHTFSTNRCTFFSAAQERFSFWGILFRQKSKPSQTMNSNNGDNIDPPDQSCKYKFKFYRLFIHKHVFVPNGLFLCEHFSIHLVTRAQRKFLEAKNYNQICWVKIARIGSLEKLGLLRPSSRQLKRQRSIQNLTQLSPPNVAKTSHQATADAARPSIDMNKIRLILKKTLDKPSSIVTRRATMPDRPNQVTFAVHNDSESDSMDETNVGENDANDLINLSGQEDAAVMMTSVAASANAQADTPHEPRTNIRNILDEFDPVQASYDSRSREQPSTFTIDRLVDTTCIARFITHQISK